MLRLIGDTTALGRHDTLFPACDGWRYAQLLGTLLSSQQHDQHDHPSCVENLRKEVAKVGLGLGLGVQGEQIITMVPDAVNLFMNVMVGEDGKMAIGPTDGTVGGEVVFEVVGSGDVLVVVCACAMDLVPGNGERLTGGDMEVLG